MIKEKIKKNNKILTFDIPVEFFLVRFIEVNSGGNRGPEKSVRFKDAFALDCPLRERVFYKSLLGICPGQNIMSVLRRCPL